MAMITALSALDDAVAVISYRESYAHEDIVVWRDDVVVCSQDICGDVGPTLFAYDIASRKVVWRTPTTNWISCAVADDSNTLFVVDGFNLLRLNLKTGKIGRSSNLWDIDWPTKPIIQREDDSWGDVGRSLTSKVAKAKSAEEKTNLLNQAKVLERISRDLKTHPAYYSLILRPDSLVVFEQTHGRRRGEEEWGRICHWVELDCRTEKVLRGGDDEYVGRLETSRILLGRSGKTCRLTLLQEGSLRDVSEGISSRHPAWRLVRSEWGLVTADESHSGRCMVGFLETPEDNVEKRAIYDSKSGTMNFVIPEVRSNCTANWVLHGQYVIRYSSVIGREQVDTGPSGQIAFLTNSLPHWLESYDLQGHLVKRGEIRGFAGGRLFFAGVTTKDEVIFSIRVPDNPDDFSSKSRSSASLLVVALPDLSVRRVIDVGKNLHPWEELHLKGRRNSDVVLQVSGDVVLEKMAGDSQAQEIVLRALNIQTGLEMWRHVEKVIIRK